MSLSNFDAGIGAGRTLAAVFGAPAVAFLVGAALVAFLPVSRELAFAIGTHAMVPLWVGLACALPLVKTGRAAWVLCAAIALPLAASLALRSAL